MPLRTPTVTSASPPAPRWWWLTAVPVLIFLAARGVSYALVLRLGHGHPGLPGGKRPQIPGPDAGWGLLASWDAQWYQEIVTNGYPDELPRDANGEVRQNPWAFFPLLPALIRLLGTLGVPFLAAGILVSLTFGCVAVVALARLVAPGSGVFTALVTVTAFSFSPVGLTFGVPYTESVALALILVALLLLGANRPGLFLLVALLLAFTRPATPALAAVVGVVWVVRWVRRKSVPFPRRDQLAWAVTAVLTAATFVLWPAITGLLTGEWDAYALTQQSWNLGGNEWSTWLTAGLSDPGMLAVPLLVLAFALLVAFGTARRWPLALRAWTVLYPLFILGASRPTPSIIRYLSLTGAAAWPVPALSQRIIHTLPRLLLLAGLAVAGTWIQIHWIAGIWLSREGFYP